MVSKAKQLQEAKQLKRLEVLGWAMIHGMVINPSKGYEQYVENFFTFHACPCDRRREFCPCPESVAEVKEKGCCLCRLFWRDLATFQMTLGRKDEKSTGEESGAAPRGGEPKPGRRSAAK